MKNLKVSFHHPSYIYKFKVELNVLEDTNMFCIDPHRTIEQYNRIISHLILTVEEKIVFETLSLAFKSEFIERFSEALKMRLNVDFIGDEIQDKVRSIESGLKASSNPFQKCKELYLLLNREQDQSLALKQALNNPNIFKLLYEKSKIFVSDEKAIKTNFYAYFHCLIFSISQIIDLDKMGSSQKQESIEFINKCFLMGWKKLLSLYDYVYLSTFSQLCSKVWMHCLEHCKQRSWIYTKYDIPQINWGTLKLIIQSIKTENTNIKVYSDFLSFLVAELHKCENVNELLLFVTECINARISPKLDELHKSIKMMRFTQKNTVYLYLPEEMSQDFGKKTIRLKQKVINQQSWQKELKSVEMKVLELVDEFNKFKSGKIQQKKQKKAAFSSERERIRKESFIMTNYEQIKTKFERDLSQDQLSQDNKHLLEVGKFYQQKMKEKDMMIKDLQLAVAEFVDVKKKYIRQKLLKICNQTVEFHVHRELISQSKNRSELIHSFKSQAIAPLRILNQESFETDVGSYILPPPPPPPKSFRGSRSSRKGSNDTSHLLPPPLPPQFSFLPDQNSFLPPPPPPPLLGLPPPLLGPPPLLTSPSLLKGSNRKQNHRNVKMINWTSVEISAVKNSFWENVPDVQFSEKNLISFFQKKNENVNAPKISLATFKQKKSLLKPERAKNIEIVLKKTRLKIAQISEAIESLDEDVLTATSVDSLLNITPTSEQFQIYVQLNIPDPQEWSQADRYFCQICKLQGYTQLLKALKFKHEFEFISEDFNNKLNEFDLFFANLEKDAFLQSFLSYLLAIGNFMNEDTNRGNAYGFKLESIEKSYILMGQDKQTCLLEYILQLMVEKEIEFPNKLSLYSKKITAIEILKEDLKQLASQCRNVQQCLLRSDEEDLRTPEVFLSFFIECREKISIFDGKYGESFKYFGKVSDFYCQKLESEKLIKIINDFRLKVLKFMESRKIQGKK